MFFHYIISKQSNQIVDVNLPTIKQCILYLVQLKRDAVITMCQIKFVLCVIETMLYLTSKEP